MNFRFTIPHENWPFRSRKGSFALYFHSRPQYGHTHTSIEERDRTNGIFASMKKPDRYVLSENLALVDLMLQTCSCFDDAYAVQAEIHRKFQQVLG